MPSTSSSSRSRGPKGSRLADRTTVRAPRVRSAVARATVATWPSSASAPAGALREPAGPHGPETLRGVPCRGAPPGPPPAPARPDTASPPPPGPPPGSPGRSPRACGAPPPGLRPRGASSRSRRRGCRTSRRAAACTPPVVGHRAADLPCQLSGVQRCGHHPVHPGPHRFHDPVRRRHRHHRHVGVAHRQPAHVLQGHRLHVHRHRVRLRHQGRRLRRAQGRGLTELNPLAAPLHREGSHHHAPQKRFHVCTPRGPALANSVPGHVPGTRSLRHVPGKRRQRRGPGSPKIAIFGVV
jgi:hypothetical protein